MLATAVAALMVSPSLNLVPWPAQVYVGSGSFTLTERSGILAGRGADAVAKQLRGWLTPATGFALPISKRRGDVSLVVDSTLKGTLGNEGYRLKVESTGVSIVGSTEAGLFYGCQTLRQLLPATNFSPTKADSSWMAPCVEIVDRPRFRWRGAHLDVCRNFMPKAWILKYLDLLAAHKFNRFHWHLTDDQGWRIEIKKYPKLTSVGSKRKDTMLVYDPPKYAGEPHEGFYTQEDVREVVAYAAARHIVVVPEIEMPGHAQAAIAAYPELGADGDPIEVGIKWGVYENVYNVKDSTIQFCKDVLDEVIDLFPGEFIHVGGDECPKNQWKASAFAQAKLQKLGLKDEHELQSWFIRQMDAHIASKGRRLIGWSEILEGGLAPGAALMVWLGNEGAEQAVKSGHDVVMAQTTHTYFDYYQAKDRTKEPHSIGGFLPIEKVYEYEPILPTFSPEESAHVLGAQFQIWTEYIRTPEHVEYMAFPRACAMAEVVWSPKESRDWASFSSRLPFHLDRLTEMGVKFRHLDPGP